MYKILAVASISLLLVGCGSLGSFNPDKKTTVVSNATVVFPTLPDIDKPVPPILKSVVWDYPRDSTQPKQIKNLPECQQTPLISDFDKKCLEYPPISNSNIKVGLSEVGFKNFIINQELLNGYIRALSTRIDEINAERAKWRETNQQKDK